MSKRINITEGKTVSADALIGGKLVASVYDSGFRSIMDVINSLNAKMVHDYDNVTYGIYVIDDEVSGWYNKKGRKI